MRAKVTSGCNLIGKFNCRIGYASKRALETQERIMATDSKLLAFLFATLVLDLIAFTSILPLLPAIISYYEQSLHNHDDWLLQTLIRLLNSTKVLFGIPSFERYNGTLIGGMLGSIFCSLQFICNPIFGAASDVFGRKIVLLMAMLGTCISYLIWINCTSFAWFFLSRVVGGISKGSVTIVTAIMSDITDKDDRGKGMAVIGISFSVGFIVGPLCGAYFAASATTISSTQNPFILPALFSLSLQIVVIFITLLWLPETMEVPAGSPLNRRMSSAFGLISPFKLFYFFTGKSDNLMVYVCQRVLLINLSFLVLFSGLEFTFTFLTYQRFGFSSKQQGLLFLYIGIIMILVQGGFVKKLKRGQEKKLACGGIFSMIPSMVIIAFGDTVLLMYVGLALFAFSAATVVPCLTTIYSQGTNASESGEMLGIFRSAGALARAVGPFLVCFFYWTFGPTNCYLIGACCFCFPLTLCYLLDTSKKKEP